jgi:hypothetical protein
MIMPYGVKPTQQREGSRAPARINFDRLWEDAIRPVIEELGYESVRADQDLGALIIHEMIERLAISDLVIADVSIPNGNVYYEVGIRHAARPDNCVMIAADWAEPLFDINQMRQIRYPLPEEVVSEETAAKIHQTLKDGVPALARGISPVYSVLPGYPQNLDVQRTSAFRATLEQLARFQGEVRAVAAAPVAERKDRALALAKKSSGAGPMQKAVALELLYLLRDYTDWKSTLQFIDQLPQDMRQLPVVKEQKALAQSKDGDHLAAIAALEELIRLSGETSERRGLMGGRYKKLYTSATDPNDKVSYLNKAIQQYELGMKADLNDYYPASNLARLYRKRNKTGDQDRAVLAASVTLAGCDRAMAKDPRDEWLRPTLLGAAFDAGNVEKAQELAEQIEQEQPAAWKLDTTIPDLELAIQFHEGDRAAALNEVLKRLKACSEA